MPLKYKIKQGDKVFACRQPGFLDAPMIIGEVAECKRDEKEPMLWDITVKPRCDIKNIKDVAIIIMNPKKTD
jgi:cell shape-determining protein MreC